MSTVGVPCPFCGDTRSQVVDGRASGKSFRRRRRCHKCGGRFTTFESLQGTVDDNVRKTVQNMIDVANAFLEDTQPEDKIDYEFLPRVGMVRRNPNT